MPQLRTDRSALRAEPASGYRRLSAGPGEPHVRRGDLLPAGGADPAAASEALLTVVHLSDSHICDAQSPARAEFLDRWADPDSPILEHLDEVGAYRAQEILTVQVLEACVRAVNQIERGPIGGALLDFAVVTGDSIDNGHRNELDWYLALLEGGLVHPDSGDLTRFEGVADGEVFDDRFWHPETARPDRPRSMYGFPTAPGLLDALRAPFHADGLRLPWLAVHGNHDQLVQGTIPGIGRIAAAATASSKPIALPAGLSPEQVLGLFDALAQCDPRALTMLFHADSREVTPDPARRIISRAEFIAAHFGRAARPPGHGFDRAGAESGVAYYRRDHGLVTMLVLDTVDEYGGWQGSLDLTQFQWLAGELAEADRARRYVVLASHHPLATLVNPMRGDGGPRMLAADVSTLLARHRCVVLWLAGHTHATAVTAQRTYWQVVAPSLIDWPQQVRIVELLRSDGQLCIAATMIDHAGVAPWDGAITSIESMAGLSRELAVNDWQWLQFAPEQHPRSGARDERNVELLLPDPWA